LGFVNFYRRFIEGYSHITRSLTELLKTSSKGEENGDGQNQAFYPYSISIWKFSIWIWNMESIWTRMAIWK
jgi:hypothetical protein